MSNSARTQRIDWSNVPVVEVERPCCPECGAESYSPIKGWADADGGRTSRRVCDVCSSPYVVISEPKLPDSGKGAGRSRYDSNREENEGMDLTSIGVMATTLQQPLDEIERAIDTLGITPHLRLNSIPYFTQDAVAIISTFLKNR